YRPDIGRGHVHGHRVDHRPGAVQPLPERLQGSGALAPAHEDDGAAGQVQDHRDVALLLAQVDLVDGNPFEVGQPGPGHTALQVALLDVLDDVPTDAQVVGHRLDGHVLRQLQSVALEGAGVAAARVGKGHIHLADGATGQAADALHGQHDGHRAAADGHGPEA